MFDLIANMDIGIFHIPLPLALAVVATLGYLFGRKNRRTPMNSCNARCWNSSVRGPWQ